LSLALIYFAYYKNKAKQLVSDSSVPSSELGMQQKSGAQIFSEKCAACHGKEAQGIIGPNLTDNYWLNGNGQISDIIKIINEGVQSKGMPSWSSVLRPEEISLVATYVFSLRGSNPQNPKLPQGKLIKDQSLEK
jgi:cytochrome c oxidase cbb3-type subunit 3